MQLGRQNNIFIQPTSIDHAWFHVDHIAAIYIHFYYKRVKVEFNIRVGLNIISKIKYTKSTLKYKFQKMKLLASEGGWGLKTQIQKDYLHYYGGRWQGGG